MRHATPSSASAAVLVAALTMTACTANAVAMRRGIAVLSPRDTAVASVYAALITAVRSESSDNVYVESTTQRYRIPNEPLSIQSPEPRDSFPASLARELERVSAVPRASAELSLPRGARIVTEAESDEIQRGGHGAGVVLAFSPVVLSEDRREAFVYYEKHCGALCGSGAAVLLERDRTGKWTHRMTYHLWVSLAPLLHGQFRAPAV